jgi:hypothetical protein
MMLLLGIFRMFGERCLECVSDLHMYPIIFGLS